jgi:signal peptide peptidase SppA
MGRRPARRALELLTTVPWAITAEGLETLVAVAHREGFAPDRIAAAMHAAPRPEGVATVPGEPLAGTETVMVRDGVATIPIMGPLFRYANLFSAISGATSYEVLATDFATAIADPAVRAILLEVDSPGGEANGAGELSDIIYDARGPKPIVAYVGGFGASAAYWLASAADRIIVNESAILGSIGVRMALLETWMRDASQGVRSVEMVSKQSPKKAMAQTDIQALIDNLAQVFIARVARNRGISAATVEADFGQGGVFVGQAAIDAGLADALGTYEALQAELAGTSALPLVVPTSRPTLTLSRSTRGPTQEITTMTPPAKPDTTPPAAAAVPETAAAAPAPTAAPATPAAPATTATPDQIRTEAASAERKRISGIQALARPGLETLITAAINDPACTPEAAAHRILMHEQAQREGRLTALEGDEKKLQAPTPVTTSPDGETPQAEAQRILAVHRRMKGEKAPAPPASAVA